MAAPQQGQPPQTPAPAPAQATPAPADPAQAQPGVRFSSQATEVILPVTVTDDRGYFVSNLEAKDFVVLDEGKPQRIQFFSHTEKQPVVIGFLVDLSSASRIQWKNYQNAIKELIWNLLPGGDKRYEGYLISYGSESELVMNTTTDGEKMADKVDRMKPGGGSALHDAIYKACMSRDLVKGEPYEPRRVIIIIGDGHDNASQHSFNEVLELAKRKMVTIFGMSTVAFGFSAVDQPNLEKLANETGGRVVYPLNSLYKGVSGYLSQPRDEGNYALQPGTGAYAAEILKGITDSVAALQGEITTQYVIRYTPDLDAAEKPKVFRKVEVKLPSLTNAIIRTRDGYFPDAVGK
jgi:Ca-activated chloride channel homolog